ncbi:MAG: transposase [Oscillospiraceae bacterium]|nr:transposase [Oscillospiraceae bacterium]
MSRATKIDLQHTLDQVFPGYDKAFSDVGGVASRAVLTECPTPQDLLLKSEDELVGLIRTASRRGLAFCYKKATKLHMVAEEAVKLGISAPGNAAVITTVLEVLETLLQNIQRIEQNMKDLARQETYIQQNLALLQTIPGIGFKSALVILSEIGDFSLFHKPKQLAAYFGLDPSERQSGKFCGSKNKMSKRSSSQVRATLHMAAVNSVIVQAKRPVRNPVLAAYYEEKCKSRPCKVAMCAVMRKISNIIFAVLRDQKSFELRQPQEHAQRLGVLSAT